MSNARTLNRGEQRCKPEHLLLMAQIQDVSMNITTYVRRGIIVDGKVTDYWPLRKSGKCVGRNLTIRGGARGKPDAEDDLAFFTDGRCEAIITECDLKTTPEAVLKRALSGNVFYVDLCAEVARMDEI